MFINEKIKYLWLIAAILTVIQSCTLNKTENKMDEVIFKGIARTYEAEYASFDPEDIAGLYVVNRPIVTMPGTLFPSGNLFDNLRFRLDGEIMRPLSPVFYPGDVSRVDFYAYLPFSSGGMNGDSRLSFSVRQEQTNSEALKQSDLLWGKLMDVQTAQSSPRIVFGHQLSKLIINLKAGNGITLNSPTVLIEGTKPSVELNMADGTIGPATGSITPITPLHIIESTMYQAIVIPQTVRMSECLFTITNNDKTYHYILKVDRTFLKESVYTFDITIHANDLEVLFAGVVNDWLEGDTIVEDITG